MVMSARDLAPTIQEAFQVAREGRPGPVLIDVPRDVQLEEAELEFSDMDQGPQRSPVQGNIAARLRGGPAD